MTSEFKKQGPAQTKSPTKYIIRWASTNVVSWNIDKKLIKNEIQFTDSRLSTMITLLNDPSNTE